MNKKSYLARVRLPRTPADWLEAMMNFIFFLCGMLAVGCVVLITVYMVLSGVPAIHKIGLFRFLLAGWHLVLFWQRWCWDLSHAPSAWDLYKRKGFRNSGGKSESKIVWIV